MRGSWSLGKFHSKYRDAELQMDNLYCFLFLVFINYLKRLAVNAVFHTAIYLLRHVSIGRVGLDGDRSLVNVAICSNVVACFLEKACPKHSFAEKNRFLGGRRDDAFQDVGQARVLAFSAVLSQELPHAKWQLRKDCGALSGSQWDPFSSLAPPFPTSCAIIHTRVLLHDSGLQRSAPLCFSLWAYDPSVSAHGDALSTRGQRCSWAPIWQWSVAFWSRRNKSFKVTFCAR